MAIRVALNHRTSYRYDRLVSLGPQVVRLRPAPHCRTPVSGYSLRVEPKLHFLNWQQDPQSNWQARLTFPEPTREFVVEIDLVAELAIVNPFDFFLEPAAEKFPFSYDPALAIELAPFREAAPAGPLLTKLLSGIDLTPRLTTSFLVELNADLSRRIEYVIRMEPGVHTPEETLGLGRGSCRDSAWLLVQILRHLGLAARFVSGYLIQLVPDVPSLDGPSGPSADFTDLHAWTEVYLPGAGWVGLDPTSGLFAGEGHIPLAATPAPSSAAPISGGVDPCEVEFDFSMSVTRLPEVARVTKPYTDEQWAAIHALGQSVDERLHARDVRLTIGGEPTFVSIDDRDGPEWNTAALGPLKRKLAGELVHRLRDRFAPGGLLHFGQGKWYPGETLPRWALGCYWRADGEPLWQDPDLIADERQDYGLTTEAAERFLNTLAGHLGIEAPTTLAAFEDPWYWVWRERRLPVNVDPLDAKLEDAEERARLARVFERGLGEPVGFALPLERRHDDIGPPWQAGHWKLRSKRLFLTPGDSPVGYRLPLDSLPWVAPEDYPYVLEDDPFAARGALPPSHPRIVPQRPRTDVKPLGPAEPLPGDQAIMVGQSAPFVIRTALCTEVRRGCLYVFVPPQPSLEAYVELVAAIETTAADLGLPVVVEGYAPPRDWRLNSILVTPDPGVIEVNVQPSRSWAELVDNTTDLYEIARQCRLSTEKFLIDGRHVGTGGGNHVVVGGPRPEDSPFLRRPHLLRSLIGYWQNHPSLSYLFSGLFIGPTSQAPRLDEARHDSLYELEIAFSEVPNHSDVPPWLVDRLFRNLLCDVTGNTHRSEICIDKLYSPDSSSGRLGLVEFRAFEMPPHARMSLVQQLLLRALIARFWDEPYHARLVRWGTDLHDRFMLPHFVLADFDDVIDDMNRAGFAFDRAWFEPHVEFRFPRLGEITHQGITLSLRQALEPWHVLGEEGAAGGTVRFVDSSLERIEIKATGLTDGRHAITVNGRRVPLQPTGRRGEFVAGVRFRAWRLPNALHPTIPPHDPLVIDLVDEWASRAVAGCTYWVSHPGGRNYVTAPVNAYEAEGRRLARFAEFGHSPGPMNLAPETPNREFPYTLDLRR
jgi:uncharacterized protein (DUF2126 family)/transglutaminase-like putative cysteine protease